jgi:hypothetical protein
MTIDATSTSLCRDAASHEECGGRTQARVSVRRSLRLGLEAQRVASGTRLIGPGLDWCAR